MKPFSQACENNKRPIHQALQRWLANRKTVLEVGSGTGQHAVFFGEQFQTIQWQCSDLPENHPSIKQWLDETRLQNVLPPILLDVRQDWIRQLNNQCNRAEYDTVFSSNTLHIMAENSVPYFFEGAAKCLPTDGLLCVYGPFNYDGNFTSDSNKQFNQWLKQQNRVSAIRDFEAVNFLAEQHGFQLQEDNTMPANNRLLIWRKK